MARRPPSTPARRSAWSAATAPASLPCSPCSTAPCTRTAATAPCRPSGVWPRWRRTCRRPTEPATDFVIAGDTRRGCAGAGPRRPHEATDDGERMAHAYMELHDAGAHDAPARAQALILGLGFKTSGTGPARQQLLRRLAHAPAAGARADVPVRPAAAGRADQPPGPRRPGLAGSLAATLPGHHAGDQPRPRISRRRDQRHAAHRERQAQPLRRQLQQVRGHAGRADGTAAGLLLQAAGKDRPPAEVHRPLQGQGQQGQAGAKPRQGAGAHGEDRAGAGRGGVHVRVQGTGQPAQPDAGHQRRDVRLRAGPTATRPR